MEYGGKCEEAPEVNFDYGVGKRFRLGMGRHASGST
jgi:hypothetical protein